MNRQKTLLQEFTKDPKAIKEARLTPIPQEEIDRSLSFLRAIVLDLPIQTGGTVEVPEVQQEYTDLERAVMEGGHSLDDSMEEIKRLAGLK